MRRGQYLLYTCPTPGHKKSILVEPMFDPGDNLPYNVSIHIKCMVCGAWMQAEVIDSYKVKKAEVIEQKQDQPSDGEQNHGL